jgi:hypothetical protein
MHATTDKTFQQNFLREGKAVTDQGKSGGISGNGENINKQTNHSTTYRFSNLHGIDISMACM